MRIRSKRQNIYVHSTLQVFKRRFVAFVSFVVKTIVQFISSNSFYTKKTIK